LLEKDGNYFIWEAKNWPLWPEKMEDVLSSTPFLLIDKATYKKRKLKVDGIIFSWWDKPVNEEDVLQSLRECVSPKIFKIYYTKEILEECIKKLPEWYVKIIENHKTDVISFFQQLLGEK